MPGKSIYASKTLILFYAFDHLVPFQDSFLPVVPDFRFHFFYGILFDSLQKEGSLPKSQAFLSRKNGYSNKADCKKVLPAFM